MGFDYTYLLLLRRVENYNPLSFLLFHNADSSLLGPYAHSKKQWEQITE